MSRFIKRRSEIKIPKKREVGKLPTGNGNDITMCKGGKCPFKDMCHRYTATPDELYQSWFTKPPFKIDKGKPSCEMFWGSAADQLFLMLKEIMGEQKDKQTQKKTTSNRKRNHKINPPRSKRR